MTDRKYRRQAEALLKPHTSRVSDVSTARRLGIPAVESSMVDYWTAVDILAQALTKASEPELQGEPSDARWIDDIETLALAQSAGHARMIEIGEGIGGLGVRNRAMFEDMVAWQDATGNGHADSVLRLVAALRAAGGVR